jgi:hypothetical protein
MVWRGSIASGKTAKTHVGAPSLEENTNLYYMSKGTRVRLVRNLTLRGSDENPRSFPREENSTSPLLIVHILQTSNRKETK